MNTFENIHDRIKTLVAIKADGKNTLLAKHLGVSEANIRGYIKGIMPKADILDKIVRCYDDISPNWLLTGRGPMLLPQDATNKETAKPAYRSPTAEESDGIPLIPIEAMAGALTTEQTVLSYECERYVVPAFKGADFLIRITGDSMAPTYRSGDLVACQRVPLSDVFFQWNKTYVLDTKQGPLIKRIKPGSDNDHILIISDNPDYEPFELSRSQFNGIALVRGLVRIE